MDLHELSKTIVRSRERIAEHAVTLERSLTNTWAVTIAPVLDVLGWDTTNPDQIVVDYGLGQNPTFSALMGTGNSVPVALLMIKRLDEPVSAYEMNQLSTFARETGVPYTGGTNGRNWKLFRGNNVILEVDITEGPTAKIAAALAPLWKEAIPTTQNGPDAVNGEDPDRSDNNTHCLGAQNPKTLGNLTGDDTPPKTMTFPDGKTHDVRRWKDYLIGTARWLYDTNRMDEAKIQTQTNDQSRGTMIIPTEEQLDDKDFRSKHAHVQGRVWVYTTYNRLATIKAAQKHLRDLGIDPTQVTIS